MGTRFSILTLQNSPSRWENAVEQVKKLPGTYIYFASESESVDLDRISRMLTVSSSADLIVPVEHTHFLHDEVLEEPLLLPQHSIFERFRSSPMLNGKLMKKQFLLKQLNSNLHDWLHSPCPDLFLLLFSQIKTTIVRTDYKEDPASFCWFSEQYRKAPEWCLGHPDFSGEEKYLLLARIAQYEDYLTDRAVALTLPEEEIFHLFRSQIVMHNYYTSHPEKLYRFRLPKHDLQPGKIRSLAVFCAGLRAGGAERCASLLLTQFTNRKDWKIYLFQDSASQPGDFPCLDQVETIILPKAFYPRQARLPFLLKEKQIDVCLFFDHFLENFYFDILTAAQLGIRTIAMEHSTFTYPLYSGNTELMPLRQAIYPTVSLVTCLSRSDEWIWNHLGINARYMPNPLTFDTAGRPPFREREGKTLIFIAKLIPGKGVLDALKTVEIVRDRHPDVKLFLLGNFPDPEFEQSIHAYVKDHHLTDQVQFTGFAKVEDYISKASVHLMPSCVEGYPMTLMEAKSFGVPTVAYSLPYLEAGKEEYGTIMVPQQDYHSMAEKVSELLDDFSRLNALGRKAWDSLTRFDNHMVFSRWEQLFEWLETGRCPASLALPVQEPKKQLDLVKIQMDELISGILFQQNFPPFRQKILDSETTVRRRNNILFGSLLRLYFGLRQKIPESAFLRGILHFSFAVLWFFKRCYRRIRPWQDEEQNL